MDPLIGWMLMGTSNGMLLQYRRTKRLFTRSRPRPRLFLSAKWLIRLSRLGTRTQGALCLPQEMFLGGVVVDVGVGGRVCQQIQGP